MIYAHSVRLVIFGEYPMDNKTLFYACVEMVEAQIVEEQEYWDLRAELEPLKPELEALGIKYIDHGNFGPSESIQVFKKIKTEYLRRKHGQRRTQRSL